MEPHEVRRVPHDDGVPCRDYPRSMGHTVPGTIVVIGEQLSGKASHLDDNDNSRFASPLKKLYQQGKDYCFPPQTPEQIKERWPKTGQLDCSALGQPLGQVTLSPSSWRGYVRPMKQNNDTCTLMASTMAIEGAHYKAYETFHGLNTFRADWKAAKGWTDDLLKTCEEGKIWNKGEGAVVDDVLTLIQDLGGVTTEGGGSKMELDKFEKHSGDNQLTRENVAKMLDQGPCVGRLMVCPWYTCFNAAKNDNWVYRGVGRDPAAREAYKKDNPRESNIGSHVVVCIEYRVCEETGEMHVRVLDNHTDDGPERWVHLEELDALYSIKVNCLCGNAAHRHTREQ